MAGIMSRRGGPEGAEGPEDPDGVLSPPPYAAAVTEQSEAEMDPAELAFNEGEAAGAMEDIETGEEAGKAIQLMVRTARRGPR